MHEDRIQNYDPKIQEEHLIASKTVRSMPERFKVVLDHARRYTSARLYLYLYLIRDTPFPLPHYL